MLMLPVYSFARKMSLELKPSAVVFIMKPANNASGAAAVKSAVKINEMLNTLGRFHPVEKILSENKLVQIDPVKSQSENFDDIAAALDVDIYFVINVYQNPTGYVGEMKVQSVNSDFENLSKGFLIRTSLAENIPNLFCREIIQLHERLPIVAEVITADDGGIILTAGQWNGLEDNESYNTTDGERINVVSTGRYESRCGDAVSTGKVVIEKFVDHEKFLREVDAEIEAVIIKTKSIQYLYMDSDAAVKRHMEAYLAINMGGSILLPGYGSFLSSSYLGFQNPKPDYPIMALTAVTYLSQLLAVPVLTGFKGNFTPFIQDNDKSDEIQRLHVFLWATVPWTFSVSYMDCLTHQYLSDNLLPAFYKNRDLSSAVYSALIPGGGLFNKGYSFAGWSMFYLQSGILGYSVYNWSSANGKYAMLGFASLKTFDIMLAYFITPNYPIFNDNFDNDKTTDVIIGSSFPDDGINIGFQKKF